MFFLCRLMERTSFLYTNIISIDRWQVLSYLISSLFRSDLVFVLGMFIDLENSFFKYYSNRIYNGYRKLIWNVKEKIIKLPS